MTFTYRPRQISIRIRKQIYYSKIHRMVCEEKFIINVETRRRRADKRNMYYIQQNTFFRIMEFKAACVNESKQCERVCSLNSYPQQNNRLLAVACSHSGGLWQIERRANKIPSFDIYFKQMIRTKLWKRTTKKNKMGFFSMFSSNFKVFDKPLLYAHCVFPTELNIPLRSPGFLSDHASSKRQATASSYKNDIRHIKHTKKERERPRVIETDSEKKREKNELNATAAGYAYLLLSA